MTGRGMHRFAAAVCAAVVAAGGLSGCGKKETETGGFLLSPFTFEAAMSGRELQFVDQKLYFQDTEVDTATWVDTPLLRCVDLATGEGRELYRPQENQRGSFSDWDIDTDGSIWLLTSTMEEGAVSSSGMPVYRRLLRRLNPDGQELSQFDPSPMLEAEEYPMFLALSGDYLVLTASTSSRDAEGTMQNSDRVYVLNRQYELLFRLDWEAEGDLGDWYRLSDGRFAAVCGSRDTQQLLPLDVENQTWGEPIPFPTPSETDAGDSYGVLCESAGEFLFLVQFDNDLLYGYDAASGEYREILRWHERDIVWENPPTVRMLADGGILAADCGEGYGVRLAPCAPADEVKKVTLTLAGIYLDETLAKDIQRFNKCNTTCRIEAKDYSGGDLHNIEAAKTRLNTELLAGTVPDILYLSGGVSGAALAKKGVLEDLYPMLDADEGLSRDVFVDGVLAA